MNGYMVKLEIGGIAVYSDPFPSYKDATEAWAKAVISLIAAGFQEVFELISVVEV